MELIGSKFVRVGQLGDFGWMIQQPEFADALFIFNDNESQFREHQRDPHSSYGCMMGGGNAVIRPYQCENPPRATGIPTGDGDGYPRLTDEVKSVIDEALSVIESLLATGLYKKVIYSATNKQGELGTGIFTVGEDVRVYIVSELRRMLYPKQ